MLNTTKFHFVVKLDTTEKIYEQIISNFNLSDVHEYMYYQIIKINTDQTTQYYSSNKVIFNQKQKNIQCTK